jgi:hypothetical protein
MTLFTSAQRRKLLENGRAQRDAIDRQDQVLDFEPVVKLFTADGNATWLLTELNPDDLAFGLCDLGLGEPELGYVSLAELTAPRGPLGLPLECDLHFDCDGRAEQSIWLRTRNLGYQNQALSPLQITCNRADLEGTAGRSDRALSRPTGSAKLNHLS